MKIIIDIPDGFIKDCDGNLDCVISMSGYEIDDVCSEELGYTNFKYQEIPKGHGRLIDADKLEPRDISPDAWYSPLMGFELDDIEDAPTIIEADKEIKE